MKTHKMKQFKFRLTVQISENWIEDGFDPTPKRMREIIQNALECELGYSLEGEIETTVVSAAR